MAVHFDQNVAAKQTDPMDFKDPGETALGGVGRHHDKAAAPLHPQRHSCRPTGRGGSNFLVVLGVRSRWVALGVALPQPRNPQYAGGCTATGGF